MGEVTMNIYHGMAAVVALLAFKKSAAASKMGVLA